MKHQSTISFRKGKTVYVCELMAENVGDSDEGDGAQVFVRIRGEEVNEATGMSESWIVARGRLGLRERNPPFPGAAARVWELVACVRPTERPVTFEQATDAAEGGTE